MTLFDIAERRKIGTTKSLASFLSFNSDSSAIDAVFSDGQVLRITVPTLQEQTGVKLEAFSQIVRGVSRGSSDPNLFFTFEQNRAVMRSFSSPNYLELLAENVSQPNDFKILNTPEFRLTLVNRNNAIELRAGPTASKLLTLPTDQVQSIAVTPDGKFLLACYSDLSKPLAKPQVSIWSVSSLFQANNLSNATITQCSRDGLLVAIGELNQVHLLDAKSHKAKLSIATKHPHVTAIAYHPNGQSLATVGADGKLCIWSTADGKLIRESAALGSPAGALDFSPEGKRIAIGVGDRVDVVDSEGLQSVFQLSKHTDNVNDVKFDSSGERLVSTGDDGIVALWDTTKGTLISEWQSQGDSITRAAWTPNDEEIAVIAIPQRLRTYLVAETRTRTVSKCVMVIEERTRTNNVPVTKTITRTKRVPYTEVVETKEKQEVEVEVDGEKRKATVEVSVPKTITKYQEVEYTENVTEVQQVTESYTVQVPKTVFEEVAYTVLVPVVHQFKTPAAESSGKPRVELLQVSEMASKAKWIPKQAVFLIHFNTPRTDFDYSSGPTVV